MLIRIEIPVDAAKIDRLLRKTFTDTTEAELVQQLREDGLLTLGVVATDEQGNVIGYAAFSPVYLMGEDRQWVGLAPLAIAPEYQRQGIGSQLIYESLNILNEFSYPLVVVLGSPDYYAKFGFKPAADYGLYCRWPDTQQAFQVYPLEPSALDGVAGQIDYSAPFDRF